MNNSAQPISKTKLFWTFFRIGLLTFGGGLAMASVIRHELILKRRWITEQDFLTELSIATMVPGAIAVNLAYLQGKKLGGSGGAFFAVLGTITPSFLVILLIYWLGLPYLKHPSVAAFLKGCSIAIVGQLAFTSFIFAKKQLTGFRSILLCCLGLYLVIILKLHPIWAVATAGFAGFILPNKNYLTKNIKKE